MAALNEQRQAAIHLLRAGQSVRQVAAQLGRSEQWVRKWHSRFVHQGWAGLVEQSRAPHQHGRRLPAALSPAISQARSELEAEAALGTGLKYVGGQAVRTRLKERHVQPLPSVATIERRLRQQGLTRRYQGRGEPEVAYPHVRPDQPHQLCQVDIVPHYLSGGQRIGCFNALDVVSRLAAGQAYAQQRAQDAADFLIALWQTLGIAHYTQLDNQDCFSGGHTHPYVLGKVVRLGLRVGTELVFSPVYHPQSNGFVERFHQEYNRHVWQDTDLADLAAVRAQSERFFPAYRQSCHQRALHDHSPQELHHKPAPRRLAANFSLGEQRLPLYAGRLHFIRRVDADGAIQLLNASWTVPGGDPLKGVWATLALSAPDQAWLSIYDAAPDMPKRTCLARHPFPLSEPVLPRPGQQTQESPATWTANCLRLAGRLGTALRRLAAA